MTTSRTIIVKTDLANLYSLHLFGKYKHKDRKACITAQYFASKWHFAQWNIFLISFETYIKDWEFTDTMKHIMMFDALLYRQKKKAAEKVKALISPGSPESNRNKWWGAR